MSDSHAALMVELSCLVSTRWTISFMPSLTPLPPLPSRLDNSSLQGSHLTISSQLEAAVDGPRQLPM